MAPVEEMLSGDYGVRRFDDRLLVGCGEDHKVERVPGAGVECDGERNPE
ncbi:MAG: hypothetical protein QME92_08620 [Bacillota bacterium]|nr:hypothetical protein [Bacillota bacterium]